MEPSGRNHWQREASRRSDNRSNKPIRNRRQPTATVQDRMVRRGSTVLVRPTAANNGSSRAHQNVNRAPFACHAARSENSSVRRAWHHSSRPCWRRRTSPIGSGTGPARPRANSSIRTYGSGQPCGIAMATGAEMGGTGLEPVTPSLSIRGSRSRQFACVRSAGMVERNPSGERTVERTRTNVERCHCCHARSTSEGNALASSGLRAYHVKPSTSISHLTCHQQRGTLPRIDPEQVVHVTDVTSPRSRAPSRVAAARLASGRRR